MVIQAPPGSIRIDRPTVEPVRPSAPEWGSDLVADMLRRLGVEYVALNPGASYRGLHDSLVNYNGNRQPSIILCNHEEVAVAIAHGYAKLRRRAMAAVVHSNVGLMHASMAIFNAFEDRAPMLVLGGNGPMDATQRRPWIDWVHTTHGQGELIREYVKWEHQPASAAATPEALLRAWHAAHTEPAGPAYIDLDAGIQEQRLEPSQLAALLDPADFPLPAVPSASPEQVREAAAWLVAADSPVILPGRVAPTQQAWDDFVALAEALGAAVSLDRQSAASFPTNHYLCQAGLGGGSTREAGDLLQAADVVLALQRNDPAGTLRAALTPPGAGERDMREPLTWPRLINVSLEPLQLSSWTADYQELPRAALPILTGPEAFLAALLEAVRRALRDDPVAQRRVEARIDRLRARRARLETAWEAARTRAWDQPPVSLTRVVFELRAALGERYTDAIVAAYLPQAWPSSGWDVLKPGGYLGGDGGAGLGASPGLTVGAALAAAGSGRATIGVLGDGATLMAPTALWTAAHHHIPALLIVANNQSYFNDEEHQDRVARRRGRPAENRWVGQRIIDPDVDFAALARSLGVEGFGPIAAPGQVRQALDGAVAALAEGRPALVEFRTAPR